jgi:inner membrane protein
VASILTHSVVAIALGAAGRRHLPASVTLWLIVLSVAPDLDVIGLALGVPYGSLMGHRGLSHSLLAAVVCGGLTSGPLSKRAALSRSRSWSLGSLAMASHGVLDGLTNGGLGVAYFSPFVTRRYFLPWRPVEVSPIGAAAFLGHRGLVVLASELVWIWLPGALLLGLVKVVQKWWKPASGTGS